MHLNKTTTHAVRLLVACARAKNEMVKVADLAIALELTQQNTFKIVHLLSRAGFVSAMRGRNGGVALARPAETIKVGDIVAAMEYPDADTAKTTQSDDKSSQNVPLMNEALSAFLDVLNQNSIADLAAAADRPAAKRKPAKSAARKSAAPLRVRQPQRSKRPRATSPK